MPRSARFTRRHALTALALTALSFAAGPVGGAPRDRLSVAEIRLEGVSDRAIEARLLVPENPALLVSGRLDPATPPAWGEEVARGLPNAVHVVFRYAAHPNAGFTGLEGLVADFVERGSASGLDTSISERGSAPAFVVRP